MKFRLLVSYVLLSMITLSFAQQKSDVDPSMFQTFAPEPSLIQDRIYNDNLNYSNLRLGFVSIDFEDATFPPAGWTIEYTTATNYWTRVTTCSGYGIGTAAAKFNFYSASSGTTQSLVTPTMAPSVAGDKLKFDHAHAPYNATANDYLKLEVSTDGTTFTVLDTLSGLPGGKLSTAPTQSASFTPTADQWATKNYDLPVGVVKIKFTMVSAYGNNAYVDNIKIGTAPANDVALFSIDMVANQLPGTIAPKATVKNIGSATNSFNVTFSIPSIGYTSTKPVTNLAPDATLQVTFDNWTSVVGAYNVKAYTQLGTDANLANDTLATTINVTSSTWMVPSAVPPVLAYMSAGASVNVNDTLYVFSMGGNTTPAGNNGVIRYNVNSNTFTTMAPLPASRVVFTAVGVGTDIYTFGGSNGTTYTKEVFKLNTLTNTWSTVAYSPDTLAWSKAALYQDSIIYVLGGLPSNFGTTIYLDKVYMFNVNTQTFRLATSLPIGIFGGAVAIYGDKIVYIGGATAAGIVATTYIGTINQTDRSQITWTSGTAYPVGTRYRWDAGTFGSKGIIVSGGSASATWSGSNETYLFNPNTDTWTQLANKPTAILGPSVGFGRIGNQIYHVMISGYTGTAAFNKVEMFTDMDVVPVELSSFVAKTSENGTLLTWSTATETNNNGFYVERRAGKDAFAEVGFIKGNGTTTEVTNYSFLDKTSTGNYTYRLRQVDFDGTTSYSQEVEVNVEMPKTFSLAQNYPNPFNPSTMIKFSVPVQSEVKLSIYNVMGELVQTLVNGVKSEGYHEVSFDASNLSSGIYIYNLEANSVDGKENFKSIKKMSFIK